MVCKIFPTLEQVQLSRQRRIALNACVNAGIWPVVVPAKTTWLLQPLDTHVFGPFKHFLRNEYQNVRGRSETGSITILATVECIYRSIMNIVESRDWSSSFQRNGFCARQEGCCERVKKALGDRDLYLRVARDRPTLELLRHCFPGRTQIPIDLLWQPFSKVRRSAPGDLEFVIKTAMFYRQAARVDIGRPTR